MSFSFAPILFSHKKNNKNAFRSAAIYEVYPVLTSLRTAAAQGSTYILRMIFLYHIYQRTSVRMGTLTGDEDGHGT